MPVHKRTRSLACKSKKARKQVTTGTPKHRHSLYDGFAAYTRSPRCTGLVSHRGLRISSPANLIPASGDQDHTISPHALAALVLRCPKRPSHPAPNVRDDRDTPLFSGARRASLSQ
jgi:hypothetical protein